MASKPRWKGTLVLGLVSVPVQLFASSEKKGQAPAGHNVHRVCMTQAKMKKHCEVCAKEIPEAELMKGYDVPPALVSRPWTDEEVAAFKAEGKTDVDIAALKRPAYVELTDEEIDSLKVESTKTIRITLTTDVHELDPLMIADTNFLTSDGSAAGAEAEAVLLQAMKGKLAIGTLATMGRERTVALMVYGDGPGAGFVLHYLRTADQLKSLPERVPLPKPDAAMVKLAHALVDSLDGALDLTETTDRYAEGMKALVASKAQGEAIEAPAAVEAPKVASLLDALKASMAAAATPKPSAKRAAPAASKKKKAS